VSPARLGIQVTSLTVVSERGTVCKVLRGLWMRPTGEVPVLLQNVVVEGLAPERVDTFVRTIRCVGEGFARHRAGWIRPPPPLLTRNHARSPHTFVCPLLGSYLAAYNHPNVVHPLGIVECSPSSSTVQIVLEGGCVESLGSATEFKACFSQRGSLDTLLTFAVDILRGLAHLADNGVVHR
jgi:hypothetical protein